MVKNPRYGITKDEPHSLPVPCGKCPECLKRRSSQWAFRLMEHDKVCRSSYFLTLTYDTSSVPITDGLYMTLCKRDTQLFWKRLRKKLHSYGCDQKISYYLVGEYGTKSERPHYHAIVFDLPDLYNLAQIIREEWQNGQVDLGTVTGPVS